MVEENKELIRRCTREGGVEAVDRFLTPDFYNHVTGRSGTEDCDDLGISGSSARSTDAAR